MRKVETVVAMQIDPKLFIDAFLVPEMLGSWWGVQQSLIEPKVGGPYSLVWKIGKEGFGYVTSGIVTSYQPDRLLEIKNLVYYNPERPFLGPMSLRIGAQRLPDYTECYLCQAGYQEGADWDWYYDAVRVAWPEIMLKLKDYLEEMSI
ncbi:MAG: SRPBCC domain-containing protein [Saprospiraceae bacterium]|nr:SRPBCC domain-containing protein [Saprospiraceae bacterium]